MIYLNLLNHHRNMKPQDINYPLEQLEDDQNPKTPPLSMPKPNTPSVTMSHPIDYPSHMNHLYINYLLCLFKEEVYMDAPPGLSLGPQEGLVYIARTRSKWRDLVWLSLARTPPPPILTKVENLRNEWIFFTYSHHMDDGKQANNLQPWHINPRPLTQKRLANSNAPVSEIRYFFSFWRHWK